MIVRGVAIGPTGRLVLRTVILECHSTESCASGFGMADSHGKICPIQREALVQLNRDPQECLRGRRVQGETWTRTAMSAEIVLLSRRPQMRSVQPQCARARVMKSRRLNPHPMRLNDLV